MLFLLTLAAGPGCSDDEAAGVFGAKALDAASRLVAVDVVAAGPDADVAVAVAPEFPLSVETCTAYVDYEGAPHHECVVATPGATREIRWASAFGLSFEGARKLLTALESAREGNARALAGLGLGREDLEPMAEGKLPSVSAIDRMARALGHSAATVHEMIARILEAADVSRRSISVTI